MLIAVIAVVVAAVLGVAYLSDRRDRRAGREVRRSGAMWRDLREANRDSRAIDTTTPNTNNISWTAASRRNQRGK